ncbi:flagellar hook-length control protein FliK [Planomonospora sp. ID67723]|uniref:flagellar hook-length control protein FliK n=1 Tax=Planomonospora sp. ID67723 TaxID=2738134 RepID=UPI0018C40343|nr:flagellar hook-length control protein FliK [Planomonospora sp. ID67723]MBG0833309.1 flagellar hook-length control protein FliK [Planomonospora sp. ID67723]
MTAPSGASGEGQTGQNGAGDAFAALLALLAGGGPLPQGVLPGLDVPTGSTGSAQTTAPVATTASFPAQTLFAAQAQGLVLSAGQEQGVPLLPAQLTGQLAGQLGLPAAGQLSAEGAQAVPAALLAGASTTTATDAAALTALAAAANANANAGTDVSTGTDALIAQSTASAVPAADAAPADPQQPQAATGPVATAPAQTAGSGAGMGTGTGEDGSRRSDTGSGPVAEATAPAVPAAPQSFATTQAAAVERVSAPAPQQPAPPASQIAVHVLPLRQDPDGIHRLTIHLHPVDLGPISVVAELRNGAVHLQLAGTSDVAFDALRSALPDLKQELEEGGFSSCTLDLQREAPNGGQPGQDRRALDQQGPASGGSAQAGRTGDAFAAPADEPPPVRPGSRLLNVRL